MIQETVVNNIQSSMRLSLYNVSPDLEEIEFGQHVQLNDDCEWVYADGTRKSYPSMLTRKGLTHRRGLQGELIEGRDEVTMTGKLTVLVTNFEIGIKPGLYDETQTYTPGAPLAVSADGKITLFQDGGNAAFIIGYVTIPPTSPTDKLVYQG